MPHSTDDFWEKYPTIPAVRDNRVLSYAEDPMLHPGPRVAQSLEIIARKVHPEAWPHDVGRCGRVNAPAARPAPASHLTRARLFSILGALTILLSRLRDRRRAVRIGAHQFRDGVFRSSESRSRDSLRRPIAARADGRDRRRDARGGGNGSASPRAQSARRRRHPRNFRRRRARRDPRARDGSETRRRRGARPALRIRDRAALDRRRLPARDG